MKTKYFISYTSRQGNGNIFLETEEDFFKQGVLLDIQKDIEKETGVNNVVINNFIKQ